MPNGDGITSSRCSADKIISRSEASIREITVSPSANSWLACLFDINVEIKVFFSLSEFLGCS